MDKHSERQEVLDRSITAIGSDIPTLEPMISDHRQVIGKSLATNITSRTASRPQQHIRHIGGKGPGDHP